MSDGITIETFGASRTSGADYNTYNYNGVSGLSFGQLIISVCCRRAAAIEDQSVTKMNQLSESSSWLKALSVAAEQIFSASSLEATLDLSGTGYTCTKATDNPLTLKAFFEKECGVDSSTLYSGSGTYAEKTTLFSQLSSLIDSASTLSQEQGIELQTLVSRRDVTYNTSASTVRALGQSAQNVAANFI